VEVKGKTDKLKDFKDFLVNDGATVEKLEKLRKEVEKFSRKFPMPGFDNY